MRSIAGLPATAVPLICLTRRMKVLVTGGTGFVGREVLRQLRAQDHTVRILVRYTHSIRAREISAEFDAVLCGGDVGDPEALAEALGGVEAVVHLVGIISELGPNTFERVHAQGTATLVRAAAAARAKRFVHLSALGTRADAVARYHRSKWAGEEAVRASGLNWTIFRPSVIYGREDRFINTFARLSRWSPVVPVLGTGQVRLQPISVNAVAESIAKALTEPRSIGNTYDLCGDEPLRLLEILDIILDVTRRRRLKLRLPLWLGRAFAVFFEALWPPFLGLAPPLTRDQLLMLEEDNVGDPLPAKELFQFRSEPLRVGIARQLTRDSQPPAPAA